MPTVTVYTLSGTVYITSSDVPISIDALIRRSYYNVNPSLKIPKIMRIIKDFELELRRNMEAHGRTHIQSMIINKKTNNGYTVTPCFNTTVEQVARVACGYREIPIMTLMGVITRIE